MLDSTQPAPTSHDCRGMPFVRSLLFLAALQRRPLAEHELAVVARLPYWERWLRC